MKLGLVNANIVLNAVVIALRPDPIKNLPIREAKNGHVTDLTDSIPA